MLATVTFNPNQLRSHFLPLLTLDEVDELILVADVPPPPLKGLRPVVPPRLLTRIVGRAAAKLVVCVSIALRERPDWVLGFNLIPHGLTALVAARLAGGSALYHQIGGPREWEGGGWWSDNKVLGRLRRPSGMLERLLVGAVCRMDAIAVMGDCGRQGLVRHGVPACRVWVVPGAIDADRVQGVRREEPEYDLVTVGALLPNKRTTDFLSAVANLVREGRTIRAAVVGEGRLRSELEAQAQAAGIHDVVSFLGFREDVHEICARSRIFVLPSRSEGLSLALVDAMAIGVAPVVSDVGEARSVIEHGSTGLLFSSGDVDALTNCLRHLLDDESERQRIGDAARSRALTKASIESVSGTLRQIIGPAPPRSAAVAGASTSRSTRREPVVA